ncbi:hypothetical protein [Microbacterium sp. MPKO10]|uniref:hypothetical protein n=1 Tax=Microbacterium sp. MPKO10 TaxID=2989818 RepID=UPI0022360A93|nr:hypothetical protein [Microbacterium sp. MPKO10]MCW4459974.1 hypothetical protein [Microbacterium sp. MPKO10]
MADEAIVPLMHALVDGIDASAMKRGDPVPDDWKSFSLAVALKRDGRCLSASGYAYGHDDAWIKAISLHPDAIKETLAAFLAERYTDGATLPVKMLFQLELATGSYNVEYEDTDDARWDPTPRNYRELQAELKPVFDD